MNDRLLSTLRQLRLSGLAQSLDVRLQEAAGHQLSHTEFLELILQDELLVRQQRQIDRHVKAAQFRELKALDEFDFTFNPSIKRAQIFDLATCRFVREHRDVLLVGPPGVGKSFLVQALGYQAIKQGFLVLYRSIFDVVRDFLHDEALGGDDKALARYLKPDLVIIDDMGMKQLPRRSGEVLFEIIMRRYETRSTVMTSNRPSLPSAPNRGPRLPTVDESPTSPCLLLDALGGLRPYRRSAASRSRNTRLSALPLALRGSSASCKVKLSGTL